MVLYIRAKILFREQYFIILSLFSFGFLIKSLAFILKLLKSSYLAIFKYSFEVFRNYDIIRMFADKLKEMETYRLSTITESIAQQLNNLLKKLDKDYPDIDCSRLARLIESETMYLFVSEKDGVIAGMLTLTYCETLSRRKYWIEDVIVDEKFRGHGFGRALVRAAVEFAQKKEGLPTIYLTSNPSRISARSLYMSEGFEEYKTGVFRLDQGEQ